MEQIWNFGHTTVTWIPIAVLSLITPNQNYHDNLEGPKVRPSQNGPLRQKDYFDLESNQNPGDSGRKLFPLYTQLPKKNFKNCSRKELLPQITTLWYLWLPGRNLANLFGKRALYPIVSEWHNEYLFTKHLVFFTLTCIMFHSFEVSNYYLLVLSSRRQTYLILPDCL